MSAANEIGRFFKQVGVTLGVAVLVLSYPVYVKWGTETLITAAIGCAISTVNVLIGGAPTGLSEDRPGRDGPADVGDLRDFCGPRPTDRLLNFGIRDVVVYVLPDLPGTGDPISDTPGIRYSIAGGVTYGFRR